jgi:leucine dehydrogenase
VSFSEVDEARARRCIAELHVPRVPAEAVFDLDMDVFAPCAVGEIITEEVARKLRARGIAGAANNQLATGEAGKILHARGVWYVPDFVANAGAVIVGFEHGMGRARTALDVVRKIEGRVDQVFEYATSQGVTPAEAAIHFARARLDTVPRRRASGRFTH